MEHYWRHELRLRRLNLALVRNDYIQAIVPRRRPLLKVDRIESYGVFVTFRVWRYFLNVDYLP